MKTLDESLPIPNVICREVVQDCLDFYWQYIPEKRGGILETWLKKPRQCIDNRFITDRKLLEVEYGTIN